MTTLPINPMIKSQNQDDLKMLSIFGIFKESIRLIMKWPKIFIHITLVSILPPSCIFLVDDWSSMFQFCDMSTLGHNQVGSPWYNNISGSIISRELLDCLLEKATFYIFSIVCSLTSISTIVYAISCIYDNQEITFKKALRVVPKVWKRYMITFLCKTFASFAISFIPFIWAMLFIAYGKLGKIVLVIEILLAVVCTLYVGISWQLVDAISVMEKICGFKALKKSRALIKGKVGVAFAIFMVAILCEIPILLPKFEQLLEIGVGETIGYKILCVVWSSLVSLFVLVTQSVFYFVCKAYHNEEIDKFSLMSEHVDEYHEEYVSLKAEII